MHPACKEKGNGPERLFNKQRGRDYWCPAKAAMLSVPTLWTVFVVNFLAVGLIWAYVMRSYPNLEAARYWTASCFAAATGAALAMLRIVAASSLLPLLAGGVVMIFAGCLAAMGIKRFYGKPVSWRATLLITGLSCAGLIFFIEVHDSVSMRVL